MMKLNYNNKSKFAIPKNKNQVVERTGIFSRLDKALNSKLAIISAPAGSGKTTTLVSWIESRNLKDNTFWISLDEREDNLETFWDCVATASGTIKNEESKYETGSMVDTLLNSISGMDKDIIFVFDDFHFINNKDIFMDIKHFIDGMGDKVHIIITSRTKPNINLARLRLNGEVTEIDRKELSFSYEETSRFFRSNSNFDISEKNIRRIRDCMEGWAAGLQIALLSMDKRDIGEIEQKFNGQNSYIQDYFSEEVMSRQSEEIKDFLLKTCVLDELNAELCNAVSCRKNSQQILEQMYDLNLFVDKSDYDGKNFRYHRLFKEYLNSRLNGINKDEAYEASNRAAKWYEENGFMNDAINQYIGVGNFKPVIHMVEAECIKKILCNEYLYVINWMKKIPQDIILKNAKFCITHMYIYLYEDISYEKYFEFAKKALENCEDEGYRKECQGMLCMVKGDRNLIKSKNQESIACYKEALSYWENDHFWNIIINLKSGVAHFYSGDKSSEKKCFEKAMLLSQAYQDSAFYLVVNRIIIFTKLLRGHLIECENICNTCINLNINEKLKKSSLIAVFYIVQALVCYEKNDIDKAEEYLIKGLNFIEEEGELYLHYYTLCIGYYVHAGIMLDRNNKPGLEKIYVKIEELEQKYEDNKLSDRYYFHKLKEHFAIFKMERFMESGKINLVEKYISKRDFKIKEELVMFSQILIHKEKSEDALMLLNKLLVSDKESLNPHLGLKAYISRAQIFSQNDQYENATRDLKEALILGYSDGFVRIFMFKHVKMSKILLKTIKSMKFNKDYYKMGEYLNKIMALYSADENVELISKREKEVLQLIENGAKNSEIAKKLFITESTAKSHILNIFNKLGVHNRVQAIAKAKEIGII